MKKITYNNKQYVLNDPQYPVEETVTDTDMNEIKEVVNFNADEMLEEDKKLKEQLEQTKDALINITTEKSDNIHVEDSSNLTAKIDAFGTSSQKTRSGKNKFDINKLNDISQITEKDSTTGTFTLSNAWATSIISSSNLPTLLKPATQYKCIADVTLLVKPNNLKSGTNHNRILSLYNNTTFIDICAASSTDEKNNWTLNETKKMTRVFTTPDDLTNCKIIGYTYYTDENKPEGSFKFENIMILEATEEDETFEEAGETPSPEIPSEIENVTGDIDITVCNKNLGNAELLYNQMKFFRSNSVRKEIVDGKECIVFNNSMFRSAAGFKGLLGRYRKQTRYVIRGKFKVYDTSIASGYQLYLNAYNSKDEAIGFQVLGADGENWVQFSFATNSGSDFDYIAFSYGNSTLWCLDMDSLEIYEGTSAEECAKNEEQLITFPLSEGQRLMDGDKLGDDGIHHVRKQFTVNGTESIFSVELLSTGYIRFNLSKKGCTGTYGGATTIRFCNIFKSEELKRWDILTLNENIIGIASYTDQLKIVMENIFGITEADNLDTMKSKVSSWLQNNNIVVEEVVDEYVEEYTEEQQEAYNKLQNVLSYKTVTNVFTNQGLLEFKYVADTQTWTVNLVKSEIANTNQQILEIAGGN